MEQRQLKLGRWVIASSASELVGLMTESVVGDTPYCNFDVIVASSTSRDWLGWSLKSREEAVTEHVAKSIKLEVTLIVNNVARSEEVEDRILY
jgi:hypothetical protein